MIVRVHGGGVASQADACKLGIARAIKGLDTATEDALREASLLTRDGRMKERKKYGFRAARRGTQFRSGNPHSLCGIPWCGHPRLWWFVCAGGRAVWHIAPGRRVALPCGVSRSRAEKASFSVNMSKLDAPKASALWIDPRTGATTPLGEFPNTGENAFATPDGWEDALLVLETAAK